MNYEKYKNTKPYELRSKNPQAWKEYHDEEARLMELFWSDAFASLGIPTNHPKAGKMRSLAWEQGHAYGYSEVYSHLGDIWEVVKD